MGSLCTPPASSTCRTPSPPLTESEIQRTALKQLNSARRHSLFWAKRIEASVHSSGSSSPASPSDLSLSSLLASDASKLLDYSKLIQFYLLLRRLRHF